jgi:two-component system cell cycle response regulator
VQFAMLSSVLLIAAGFGFVTGRLTIPIDLNAHAVSPSGWIAFLLVTTVVPFVMIHAIGGFQKTVLELLARIHSQRDQLLLQRDLLDRQRAQLEILASHDSLTGLPLARLAADRLRATLDQAEQSGTRTALLFIYLDGFKAVNDTHGHEVGDQVLTEVARRLKAALRGNDTVARIGGDEFILLLVDARDIEAAAQAVATKLLTEITQPIVAAGTTVSVGASIGIAVGPGHAADIADLRRRADAAMYRAKRAGKNRYCFAEAGEPQRPESDSTPQC